MKKKTSLLFLSLLSLTLIGCKKQDSSSQNPSTNDSTDTTSSKDDEKILIDVSKYYTRLSNNIKLTGKTTISSIGDIDIDLRYSKDNYYLSINAEFASLSSQTMYVKRGEGDSAISQSLNVNNEIEDTNLTEKDKDITFKDFENPFKDLTVNDYEPVDEVTFKLKDSEKSDSISNSVLKGAVENTEMVFRIDNQTDKLYIVIKQKEKDDKDDNKQITMSALALEVDDTLDVAYTLKPIETTSGEISLDALQIALKNIKNTNNNFTYSVKNSLNIIVKAGNLTMDKKTVKDISYDVCYTSDGYKSDFDASEITSLLESIVGKEKTVDDSTSDSQTDDNNNDADDATQDDKKKNTSHGIYKHNETYNKYTVEDDYAVFQDEVEDFQSSREKYTPIFNNISEKIFHLMGSSFTSTIYSCDNSDLAKQLVNAISEDSDHKMLSYLVDKVTFKVETESILQSIYNLSEISYDINVKLPLSEYVTDEEYKKFFDEAKKLGLDPVVEIALSTTYTIKDLNNTKITLTEKPITSE